MLQTAGIRSLIDTRTAPPSRRVPHFRGDEMAQWLPACETADEPGPRDRSRFPDVILEGKQSGEILARVATVNDLHFGETVCGLIEGIELGPALRDDPGSEPYPVVMNRAAVSEMAAISPDLVVAKGDLTATGCAAEYDQFQTTYRTVFGDRLIVTLGNHDKPREGGEVPPAPAVQSADFEGIRVVVLDTARPGRVGGQLTIEQADELDELALGSDRPVLVFGHHPVGGKDIDHLFGPRSAYEYCLDPSSSSRLVGVVARRPGIAGYFAGHTHRNRVRHLRQTGTFPWVEVGCVKDFPGSWAEYRISEGVIEQVHHRISDPEALRWSERCRSMFGGRYPLYALGQDSDRNFELHIRDLQRRAYT